MKFFLYKSSLCPRCYLAKRYLDEIFAEHSECELETIDLVMAPLRFRQDNIRMLPTLRTGDSTLAMLIPTRERIRSFVEQNLKAGQQA